MTQAVWPPESYFGNSLCEPPALATLGAVGVPVGSHVTMHDILATCPDVVEEHRQQAATIVMD